MKKQTIPAKDWKDDLTNCADMLVQESKKPHDLNGTLHVPKLDPGVVNVEDVFVKASTKAGKPDYKWPIVPSI